MWTNLGFIIVMFFGLVVVVLMTINSGDHSNKGDNE